MIARKILKSKKLSDETDLYFNKKGKIKWRYKWLNYWDALNKLFLYKYCSGAVIGLIISNHFKFTIIELIITGFALGMFLASMHEKPIN